MKKYLSLICIAMSVNMSSAQSKLLVSSPGRNVSLEFSLTRSGEMLYAISYKNKQVIQASEMGFELLETYGLTRLPDMKKNFSITKVDSSKVNESWNPVWGEVKTIRNNYNEVNISLSETTEKARKLNIVFRVFDDGVGFRYEFPEQPNLPGFTLTNELTQFRLKGEHKAFWIPGDFDSNEFQPITSSLNDIDASVGINIAEIAFKTNFNDKTVQTPLMLKRADSIYINIHEASLVNYPAMNLEFDPSGNSLGCRLVPDAFGYKAHLIAPAKTPWRTILVSDDARKILESKTILNLNEPSKIKNVSWIKPMKYVGVWWMMQIGTATWNRTSGKHGATTANVKRYIDFAAKHGIDGVLVEGWNTGWEDWFGKWKEEVFDFITPYPDFDLPGIVKYAAAKKVKLIMHHETSGSVSSYERQVDTAFRMMKKYGYDAVKTGYVGRIIPRGEHHDGQWMINHYIRIAEKAAAYRIMIDVHEPVRPTGLHRTYPNWLACEAARGNEFNAFSIGNKPEHETILPFTRLMGGPMDYTPGIFETKMSIYDPAKKEMVHTTLVKQLALYVTMYSPLQMAADLVENYEKYPDAFQFIKDVPVDWDDTKVLEAEPGDYITIARKEKGKDAWFIGAITDEHSRNADIKLDFLSKGKKYVATIYADATDAHWDNNPKAYTITKLDVNDQTVLNLKLAEGGGAAVSITIKK